MTETEWLASNDFRPILYADSNASDRKLRLFAVACCRCLWKLLKDDRSRTAVEVAERLADGEATESERQQAYEAARAAAPEAPRNIQSEAWAAYLSCQADARLAARDSSFHAFYGNRYRMGRAIALLHCIFPNPFRPEPTIDPEWLSRGDGTVARLAARIYSTRTYRYLPLVADALEDANCTDSVILGHCRSGRKHVRGCWVVDLLLGKK